jgi:hypothetical protein
MFCLPSLFASNMKFPTFIAVFISTLAPAEMLCASPLVVEQFIYPDGELNGQNGGSGWSGGWFGAGDTVFHPGLSYSDGTSSLDVAGGAIQLSGSASGEFRNLFINLPLGTTLYVGFICQVTAGDLVGLNLNSAPNGQPPELLIGKLRDSPNWGIQDFVGDSSISTVPATEQSFLVLRIEVAPNGLDTFRLYVNPSLSAEPAAADASFITNNGAFSITQARVQETAFGIGGSVSSVFDELRFGATYGDVTPRVVPEPSQIALIILGIAGAAGLSLRKACYFGMITSHFRFSILRKKLKHCASRFVVRESVASSLSG